MVDVIGFGALNLDMTYRMQRSELLPLLERFGIVLGTQAALPLQSLNGVLDYFDSKAVWEEVSGGGSAANTVFALDRMGFRAGYIGRAGRDPAGAFILDSFGTVDVSQVQKGGHSGICIVLVDETGERTCLVFPRCNDDIRFEEINIDYARQTEFLHLTSFAGEAAFEAQIRLVERLGHGVKISFDPGELYAARGLQALMPILSRSYIVFANVYEIELLTGKDWRYGAHDLLDCGPKVIVCKRGGYGSVVFTKIATHSVPVAAVNAVDTTGAGDVYAAGFLAGLLRGLLISTAALIANKAAACSVASYGRESYPDQQWFIRHALGGC